MVKQQTWTIFLLSLCSSKNCLSFFFGGKVALFFYCPFEKKRTFFGQKLFGSNFHFCCYLFSGTWNVNAKQPAVSSNLVSWLDNSMDDDYNPQIYVIGILFKKKVLSLTTKKSSWLCVSDGFWCTWGLQEICDLNAGNLVADNKVDKVWRDLVKSALPCHGGTIQALLQTPQLNISLQFWFVCFENKQFSSQLYFSDFFFLTMYLSHH